MPGQVLRRQCPAEAGKTAVLPEQKTEQHGKAGKHEHELQCIRAHDRTQPIPENINKRKNRAQQHRQPKRQRSNQGEKHSDHEQIRRRQGHDEQIQSTEQASPPAIGGFELLGHGNIAAASRRPGEEQSKKRGKEIIRHAENQPVGQAVQIGKLADAQNTAVPGRDQ